MKKDYNRREWLKTAAIAGTGAYLGSSLVSCIQKSVANPNVIMVVSGWQDVNIGDIAHTPGLLNLLQTYLPETKIILWKKSFSEKVKDLLETNFPKVDIIYGHASKDGSVESAEVLKAMESADILIHGSGPYIVGDSNVKAWMRHTEKPFGVFGVTIGRVTENIVPIVKAASFIFTRETKSLKVLSEAGVTGENIRFGPDATFYFNLSDEQRAQRFLNKNELEQNKFICVIPRLRYTPYYKIKPNKDGWSEEQIKRVESHNNEHKEKDHAKMREVMIAWVRQTGNKILVCPEMTYQVDIMDELLINPLPDDVKPYIVKHGYWLPDEAASIYTRANSVFSFECHSPIIAARSGTPIFYLRQPEDTIKGQMYYDLGLSDWVFEIDETEAEDIVNEAKNVWNDYDGALLKLKNSITKVDDIYSKCTSIIKANITK